MLVTLEEVVAEVQVSERELTAWVEQRWVLPITQDGRLLFDEADCARIKLIAELRRDLAVDDEALPVVLQLLDQVYSLRRTLNALHDAIAELPAEARATLDSHLRQASKP